MKLIQCPRCNKSFVLAHDRAVLYHGRTCQRCGETSKWINSNKVIINKAEYEKLKVDKCE